MSSRGRSGAAGMLAAAWRDLQWRRRRFFIVMFGTSLVFAVTLITTGVARGFDAESRQTVEQQNADAWYVQPGSLGPFFGVAGLPPEAVTRIRATYGEARTSPVLFTPGTLNHRAGAVELAVLFGALPGHPGFPAATSGRDPRAPGEVLISASLGAYKLGGPITVDGRAYTVVGKVKNSKSVGGRPNIYFRLDDLQSLCCGGLPVVWSVAVRTAAPHDMPAVLRMDRTGAWHNLASPAENAKKGVVFLSVLLWIVAAAVIGAAVYSWATERTRDFAVFKATGVRTVEIVAGLVMQAVILAVVASIIGAVIATVIAPLFPLTVDVIRSDIVRIVLVSVGIGLVASLFGVRRATAVDPALAFGLA